MSLLTYCREVRAKQAIVCFSWNAIPVLHSCSAPLVFSFIRFYHCPTKKNQFRWKAKQEEPKKMRRERVKKMTMTYFSEDPPVHKPQILLPPFGSEALWDWKQGPTSSRECIVPHRGPHGGRGAPERIRGASQPQTQRGPSHLGRKGSMGARQRARESPQTCERVPTGASWDWLGIVSLQHSGNEESDSLDPGY